ncbi:MAG: hypothetical protein HC930_10465 [Hydrococcus sp. SU_1_0]|nr:hypothetical protein [Hydrococcus sp. SU_1_0]
MLIMFSISKKFLSLLCVLTLAWFYFATPALTSTYDDRSSEGFLEKCLFSQPDTGIEEVACEAGKSIATGGVIVGVCYAADVMATGIFPPAITLAPLCNVLGVAGAGSQTVNALNK